ncbi:hypothetical protein JTE90_008396 [Oedothorax gibbosus]|uniref:Uncharacterized protein n=1 Tax=Oedothorax gibbosus TaxID=931172 RepID=A0AAV6V2U8_9ARAC|nr:hypothetical protein JTE90_008396 [Oedothorax gibbosus]
MITLHQILSRKIFILSLSKHRHRVTEKKFSFENPMESIVYVQDMKEVVAMPTRPADMRQLRHHTSVETAHLPIQVIELPKKVKRLTTFL